MQNPKSVWAGLAVFLGLLLCLLPLSSSFGGERQVKLTAADGHPLAATLTMPEARSQEAGVVLLHMYRRDRRSWDPLVKVLAARGITVLAFDLRGHGGSRYGADGSDGQARVLGREADFFAAMHLDGAAALQYLLEVEQIAPHRLALVGASVGASIAIQTALTRPRLAGVVVMTPGEKYLGIPTLEHAAAWPGIPLLILTSAEEAGRGAAELYRRLGTRDVALRTFPQTGVHGTDMLGRVTGVEWLVADWLTARIQEQK